MESLFTQWEERGGEERGRQLLEKPATNMIEDAGKGTWAKGQRPCLIQRYTTWDHSAILDHLQPSVLMISGL